VLRLQVCSNDRVSNSISSLTQQCDSICKHCWCWCISNQSCTFKPKLLVTCCCPLAPIVAVSAGCCTNLSMAAANASGVCSHRYPVSPTRTASTVVQKDTVSRRVTHVATATLHAHHQSLRILYCSVLLIPDCSSALNAHVLSEMKHSLQCYYYTMYCTAEAACTSKYT
jgi:hypothetical protein